MPSHLVLHCPTRHCRICRKIGLGYFNKDCSIKGKQSESPFQSHQPNFATVANDHMSDTNESLVSSSKFLHDLASLLQSLISQFVKIYASSIP